MPVKSQLTIRLDEVWCKRCGICVAICPRNVFSAAADGRPSVDHPEACTGCLLCELQCPDFALEIVEGQ